MRHGAPADALEVQDIPVPDVGPGEVRIAVSAASLNFGDIARCRGTLASVQGQVPFTLGMDVCGVVDAAGAGAEEWLGRRVVAMTTQSFGGIAEAALSSPTSVFDAPPELDDMEAARGLYATLGFEEVPPYYYNPIPGAHYLKAVLGAAPSTY